MADVLIPADFFETRALKHREVITYDFTVRVGELANVISGLPLIQARWQFINQPHSKIDVSIVRPDGTVAASSHTTATAVTPDLRGASAVSTTGLGRGGPAGISVGGLGLDDGPNDPPPQPIHDIVRYELGPDDPSGTWQLKITTRGPDTTIRVDCRHPLEQRGLNESSIPLSLIERFIDKINRLIGAQIIIDRSKLRLLVRPEFSRLFDLQPPRPIDLEADLGAIADAVVRRIDGETRAISVSLVSAEGRPRFKLLVDFGGTGKVDLRVLSDSAFDKITLTATPVFTGLERHERDVHADKTEIRLPGRTFQFTADADPNVSIQGQFNLESTARETIAGAQRLRPEVFASVAEALTDSLLFMATGRRDRVVFDLQMQETNLVVRHYQAHRPRTFTDNVAFDPRIVFESSTSGTGAAGGSGTTLPVTAVGRSRLATATTAGTLSTGGTLGEPGSGRKIDHVVVLMMENRSFDNMLGYLSLPVDEGGRARNDVDGLKNRQAHSNPRPNSSIPDHIFPLPGGRTLTDPDHGVAGVREQIADGAMSGFVQSYHRRVSPVSDEARLVMGYHPRDIVNVYDMLAREFGVCDRWFCSHPGPTYPNRFVSVSGKTPAIDNLDIGGDQAGAVRDRTIFDLLSSAGVSWNYVEGNIAFLRMFDRYRLDESNIIQHGQFLEKAESGRLPAVTWIDPNFGELERDVDANDDHAPADVSQGQQLVADIYNALISNPQQWAKTLFVVTYDEHGGFFDHVAPPGVGEDAGPPIPKIHPDGADHLGPRVPALLISPWIERGHTTSTVFDHTSILKTIMENFLGEGDTSKGLLGERADAANSLLDELSEQIRNDRPEPPRVAAPAPMPPDAPGRVDPTSFHLGMRLFPFGINTRAKIAKQQTD